MSQDQGASAKADRATRASPEPASGLGQKASVPCAARLREAVMGIDSLPPSIQSMENIRIVDAANEAAALIEELYFALMAGRREIVFQLRGNEALAKMNATVHGIDAALAKARGQ